MSLAKDVRNAVRAADTGKMREILVSMSESERKANRDEILSAVNREIDPRDRLFDRRSVALVAHFGISTARQVRSGFFHGGRNIPVDDLVAVLAARPKRTRDSFLKLITEDGWHRWLWPVVFEFVRSGEIERPQDAGYAVGAAVQLALFHAREWYAMDPAARIEAVLERIRTDPALLEEFRIALHHEEAALAASQWSGEAMVPALAAAVHRGLLDRDDAIDLAFEGCLRDFRPTASRFFQKLIDALEVTADEYRARRAAVVRMATATDPGVQWVGINALLAMSPDDDEPDSLLAAARAALEATTKKLARVGFKALTRALRLDPEGVLNTAAVGLGHTRADVQEMALSFIETNMAAVSDRTSLTGALLSWTGSLPAQLDIRLAELTGLELPADPEPDTGVDVAALAARVADLDPDLRRRVSLVEIGGSSVQPLDPIDFRPWDGPILDSARKLPPMVNVDEMVEAAIAAMADTIEGIDLERLLAALVRTAGSKLPPAARSAVKAQYDRLTAMPGMSTLSLPVLVRAWLDRVAPPALGFLERKPAKRFGRNQILGRLTGGARIMDQMQVDLGFVAYDGGRIPSSLSGFVDVRIWEVAHVLADGRPQILLAEPTHDGAWIDPEDLVDRLEQIGTGPIGRFDACQALLRVAPVPTEDLGRRLASLGTEMARAVARALGAGVEVEDEGLRRAADGVGPLPEPTLVVRPARSQHHADQTVMTFAAGDALPHRRRDDPAGGLASVLAEPPKSMFWWSAGNALLAPPSRQDTSAAVTVLPRFPDLYGAAVAATAVHDPDSNRTTDQHHVALEPLLDPDVPMGPGAHAAIAMALVGKNETLATTAVDLTIAAIEDGRFDADRSGSMLGMLLDQRVGNLGRASDRLATVARTSLLHADAIRRTLQAYFRNATELPRDTHAGLQTLLEAGTAVRRGLDDPAVRGVVEAVASGSSKRAKLARSVLELPADWLVGAPERQALEARLARAERWAAARR